MAPKCSILSENESDKVVVQVHISSADLCTFKVNKFVRKNSTQLPICLLQLIDVINLHRAQLERLERKLCACVCLC